MEIRVRAKRVEDGDRFVPDLLRVDAELFEEGGFVVQVWVCWAELWGGGGGLGHVEGHEGDGGGCGWA